MLDGQVPGASDNGLNRTRRDGRCRPAAAPLWGTGKAWSRAASLQGPLGGSGYEFIGRSFEGGEGESLSWKPPPEVLGGETFPGRLWPEVLGSALHLGTRVLARECGQVEIPSGPPVWPKETPQSCLSCSCFSCLAFPAWAGAPSYKRAGLFLTGDLKQVQ